MSTLSSDEMALLRSLVEWRRANGWTLRCRKDIQHREYDHPSAGTVDVYRQDDTYRLGDRHFEVTIYYWVDGGQYALGVWPRTVAEAADLMVSLKVLPVEFSSAWAAGWESAYDRDEWRVVAVHPRSGELLMNEQRGRGAACILLKAARTFDPDARLEHRRVPIEPSWARVPEAGGPDEL